MAEPAIVLIEDELPIRRFLRATLTTQGCRLFEATTGADGLVEAAHPPARTSSSSTSGFRTWTGLDVIRRLRDLVVEGPDHRALARWRARATRSPALDAGADELL
jgi:two-component system KDP operon response regulator KdpE